LKSFVDPAVRRTLTHTDHVRNVLKTAMYTSTDSQIDSPQDRFSSHYHKQIVKARAQIINETSHSDASDLNHYNHEGCQFRKLQPKSPKITISKIQATVDERRRYSLVANKSY